MFRPPVVPRAVAVSLVILLGLGQVSRAAPETTGSASSPAGNPFRGNASAIAAGQQAFNTHCARCHGQDASQPSAEAPDLRRLNAFCNRLNDASLKRHCLSDVDTYFLESVREGKVRAGVLYMPPWKSTLSEETMWEIRSFVESRPLDPPRVRTSVDRQAAP